MPDRAVLEAFGRAIDRETHNLSRSPGLLWQQVYNRLQWEDQPIIDGLVAERMRRIGSRAQPWLRTRAPYGESRALIRTLAGHGATVLACAVSPDGRHVVSASADGTLKTWDSATGREIRTFSRHFGAVLACAWSADGTFLVSGSTDGTLNRWDPTTGEELQAVNANAGPLVGCAVSPDGTLVGGAHKSGMLSVWHVGAAGLEKKVVVRAHRPSARACAFSPDGAFLVSVGADTSARVWDVRRGRRQRALRSSGAGLKRQALLGLLAINHVSGNVPHDQRDYESRRMKARFGFYACAVSPDGSLAALAGLDEGLRVRRLAVGHGPELFAGDPAPVRACAFSPDGRYLVSANPSGTLTIWDLSAGVERGTLIGHGAAVRACAVTPDSARVVSASEDGTLKIWSLAEAEKAGEEIAHAGSVAGCAWSPAGDFYVSASHDKTLAVWDSRIGRRLMSLSGHSEAVTACAVGPRGSFVVSGSADNTLRIWNPSTGRQERRLKGHKMRRASRWPLALFVLGLSGGGAGMGQGIGIPFVEMLGGRWREVTGCAADPSGAFVVSASRDSTLRIWDVHRGRKRATLGSLFGGKGHSEAVTACAITPDGSFVVSAGEDTTLRIWDAARGDELMVLTGHRDPVRACAVSSNRIVSASDDTTLRVGETRGAEIRAGYTPTWMTLRGHTAAARGCCINSEGTLVASVGDDATLRLWDAESGNQLAFMPLLAKGLCVAMHPAQPSVLCGDEAGNLYVVSLVGGGRNGVWDLG